MVVENNYNRLEVNQKNIMRLHTPLELFIRYVYQILAVFGHYSSAVEMVVFGARPMSERPNKIQQ